MVSRRAFLFAVSAGSCCLAQTAPGESGTMIRGRLRVGNGQSWFEAENGKRTLVSGDEPTGKILHDTRLSGRWFEAKGRWTAPASFRVDPIETRPMVVVDGAKRFRVTYYCDVCSIRTYSPGPCMCCQAETRLDLIDPTQKD